jgi:hypothetical protein
VLGNAEIGVFEKPQVPNRTANTVRLSFFTLRALPQFLHTFLLFIQLSNLFFQPDSYNGFTRCVIGVPTKANLPRTI